MMPSYRQRHVEVVTEERLSRADHYRLQVNTDQELVAFVYNALAEFYPRATVQAVRNDLALAAEQQLRARAALLIKGDPAFRAFLQIYLDRWIEPPLKRRAQRLYESLGWKDNGNTLL